MWTASNQSQLLVSFGSAPTTRNTYAAKAQRDPSTQIAPSRPQGSTFTTRPAGTTSVHSGFGTTVSPTWIVLVIADSFPQYTLGEKGGGHRPACTPPY